MTTKDSSLGTQSAPDAVADYEPPQLTPIGNLRDLLAHTSGSQCDDSTQPTSGTDAQACG